MSELKLKNVFTFFILGMILILGGCYYYEHISYYRVSEELLQEEDIIEEYLTKKEKDVLEKFREIKPQDYSKKYLYIVENNREILEEPQGTNVGSLILKKLLLSNRLNDKQNLYVMEKLKTLKIKEKNFLESIRYTLEYIQFAKYLGDDTHLAMGKISLAMFMSNLRGYLNANEILLELIEGLSEKNDDESIRIKIWASMKLVENYIYVNDYGKAIEYLKKMENYMKNQSRSYREDLTIILDTFYGEVYINLDEPKKAFLYLKRAQSYLKKNGKKYFLSKGIYYNLIRENYNLKYNIKEFSEKIVLDEVQNAILYNDLMILDKGSNILFEYYERTLNFEKYYELKKLYDHKISEINALNYKFLTLYMLDSIDKALSLKKNKELLQKLLLLIFVMGGLGTITIIILKDYKKMKEKSYMDELTEIGNRRAFDEKLKIIENEKYYMLLFDVDNFKQINDNYGHKFGDEVLKKIGKVLKNTLNKNKMAYRVGGEEFAVIFQNMSMENAILESEKIRVKIQLLSWDNSVVVTITGGLSLTDENVYEICDELLYEGKRQGKNRIIF